jgi:hypothetical protein
VPGQLADLAILSADYFSVAEEEIKQIESILTLVDGKVVYAAGEFAQLGPRPLPALPEWSPVGFYGGYHATPSQATEVVHACRGRRKSQEWFHRNHGSEHSRQQEPFGSLGCECFAF